MAQLEALSQRYAPYREQWQDGRGLPELTVALREVAVGDVLRSPTRSGLLFLVGRRIAQRSADRRVA